MPPRLTIATVAALVGDPDIPDLATGRASVAELHRLVEMRCENAVEIDQPLVLISQVGRSGGTLLLRLLDGHPELHVHPYELHIGHPHKYNWPSIDPQRDPDKLYRLLHEPQTERLFWHGYYKQGRSLEGRPPPAEDVKPFGFLPTLQQRLFNHFLRRRYVVTMPRDVLDCYMSSLFNAWLDYAGLYGDRRRWVVAYTPMLGWGAGRKRFFGDYPDGRLIGVLRDAESWWASARTYDPESYGDLEFALEVWRRSTREMIEARRELPRKAAIVSFPALVRTPKRTLRALTKFLGIDFNEQLLMPTFNGMPVPPNSSFGESVSGIVPGPADRGADLTEAERKRIRQATLRMFRRADELSLRGHTRR